MKKKRENSTRGLAARIGYFRNKKLMTHSLKCYPTFFACARTIFF